MSDRFQPKHSSGKLILPVLSWILGVVLLTVSFVFESELSSDLSALCAVVGLVTARKCLDKSDQQ